jgi:uncharacterized membrane protein
MGPWLYGLGFGRFGALGTAGWIIGLILNVAIIAGIIWLVVWAVRRMSSNSNTLSQNGVEHLTPREILQVRYARGEITREQFILMQDDLKG